MVATGTRLQSSKSQRDSLSHIVWGTDLINDHRGKLPWSSFFNYTRFLVIQSVFQRMVQTKKEKERKKKKKRGTRCFLLVRISLIKISHPLRDHYHDFLETTQMQGLIRGTHLIELLPTLRSHDNSFATRTFWNKTARRLLIN